jgi:hypothetical protein
LAGQVLLKIVCLLMRWLFGLAVLVRGDRERSAELLVLRHKNAVLRRNAGRVRYDPGDRAWFSVLTQFIPRRRWAEVLPVTPATLLAWHRKLAARKYDTSKRRPARPAANGPEHRPVNHPPGAREPCGCRKSCHPHVSWDSAPVTAVLRWPIAVGGRLVQ